MKNYVCSEYFGNDYQCGEYVNNVQHQDLMNLSFPDQSFDLIISADVFEHIPDPYQAHREVFRVLKPGDAISSPFPSIRPSTSTTSAPLSRKTARSTSSSPRIYHHDPLRVDEGCLVFSMFSIEMLVRLRRIGFRSHLYRAMNPWLGIFGNNSTVFEAIKWDPPSELPSDDWFLGSRRVHD